MSAVEINSQPAMAEIYGATKGTGEGFISYKGKINHIESQFAGAAGLIYTEQEFINSIIKSTRNKFKTVYFIEGHGERDSVNDKDENGCLASAGYVWSKLNKDCVKGFTGIQLNPMDKPDNEDEVLSAFVLFSEDASQAEVFLPNASTSSSSA